MGRLGETVEINTNNLDELIDSDDARTCCDCDDIILRSTSRHLFQCRILHLTQMIRLYQMWLCRHHSTPGIQGLEQRNEAHHITMLTRQRCRICGRFF